MIAKPAGGEPVAYDFFVQTPRRKRSVKELSFRPILANFGTAKQQFHIGQGTIATPGSVKGIFQIHRDLGSVPLAEIAAPAIQFARDGVPLNATQAYLFQITRPIYTATAEARAIFCGGRSGQRVPEEGEVVRQPELAGTIERLTVEGERVFYHGEMARAIVAQCQEHGGHLTREDLESYQIAKRQPLVAVYRGSRVITNPPPSSGGVLIAFALELLKASLSTRLEFGTFKPLLPSSA